MPAEGEDMSRVRGISDGVFAFAMTLLVITFVVPTAMDLSRAAPGQSTDTQLAMYLVQKWAVFFAYALAFYIAARWWSIHHRLFRSIYRFDANLTGLNFVLLGLIAITPFEAGLLGAYGTDWVAIAFYAGAQALVGTIFVGMTSYLMGSGRRLLYSDASIGEIARRRRFAAWVALGFAVAIPVGVVSPVAAWVVMVAIAGLGVLFGRKPSKRPGT